MLDEGRPTAPLGQGAALLHRRGGGDVWGTKEFAHFGGRHDNGGFGLGPVDRQLEGSALGWIVYGAHCGVGTDSDRGSRGRLCQRAAHDARRLVGGDLDEGVGHIGRQLAGQRREARPQVDARATRPEGADYHAALGDADAGLVGVSNHGVVGAAQSDGRQRSVETVLVLGGLAPFARHGAAGALLQVQADAAGLGLVFVEFVGADGQLAAGAQ